MVSINDINHAIISGNFTNEQLNSISMAIKFARNQLVKENRGSLVIGTKVKFTSSRNGQTYVGDVTKIARKYVTVRSPGYGLWRVPANMLEAV
jgi:exoribonuclease R